MSGERGVDENVKLGLLPDAYQFGEVAIGVHVVVITI